jgi:phosphoribosylglycinamide formyltransferase-1
LINKKILREELFIDTIDFYKPHLIVLGGFLQKLPSYMVHAYQNKIINIHPALLPKYGGKGMYGHFVHEAVLANKEKESGMTIHMVNDQYDEGTVLLQKKVKVEKGETPETLAAKILKLEHQ